MKYLIILGDGMADEPIEQLGGKTPLEAAQTPYMDILAKKSEIGIVSTIPEGMAPGSDTANLAVLGYDPKKYYSGRSPLEALSIGIDMKETDVAFRCNLVTLSEDEPYESKTILDHSSDEISSEDAAVLIEALKTELPLEGCQLYAGVSYRHCLIWENGQTPELIPPHDILGRCISSYLPEDEMLLSLQKRSYEILSRHPLNLERKAKGLNPANSCWFWGAGTKPKLTSFEEAYHKKGKMISAVDLLKGIAIGAGMAVADVEGANGGLHTNYEGKAQAGVDALLKEGYDFAYIHLEGPDEMGHQGSVEKKIKAIEFIDGRVLKYVLECLEKSGEDFRILILPDHPTPIRVRTHTSDPVPYLLYDSTRALKKDWHYNEREADASGNDRGEGYNLMSYFLQ